MCELNEANSEVGSVMTERIAGVPAAGYSASAFMGTVVEAKGRSLRVRTASGDLALQINRWTKVSRIENGRHGSAMEDEAGRELTGRDCIGQLVMGRMIACGRPADEQARRICTELHLQGRDGSDPSYLSPEYWVGYLADLATWWLEHAVDREHGGYFTDLAQDGSPSHGTDGTDKWPYVVSRTLYAFSNAFALTGDRRFLEAAHLGAEFLRRKAVFQRSGHTLFFTRLDGLGRKHAEEPDVVNIFTQIYSLTGPIAYYDVVRCPRTRAVIEANLRSLAELYHDPEYGGYFDAIGPLDLTPQRGVTDSKSFNSIVDPLSATLYFAANANLRCEHLDLQVAIRELCTLILEYMIDAKHNFIREIFDRTWQCRRPPWRNPYNTDFDAGNIGGNLKVIWVLLRAVQDLPPALAEAAHAQAERIWSNLLKCGAWDAFRGGWFEIMWRESCAGSLAELMGHTNKVWWQQEEGIMASLLMFLVHRDGQSLEMARDGLRFWLTCFVDRANGGIFDTVSADGWPLNGLPLNRQKGSWLKGGYHETELARFVHVYLSVLQNRTVAVYYAYDRARETREYRSVPARIPGLTWFVAGEEQVAEDILRVEYGYRWIAESGARTLREERPI